jgi:iron complex outermembrane receptor protein
MAHRALTLLALGAIALLGISRTLHAQSTAALGGRITVAGVPASDVTVFVQGTTRGAASDADGRFRISGIAPGQYVVVAQRVGSSVGRATVAVVAGETSTLDFALENAATSLAALE